MSPKRSSSESEVAVAPVDQHGAPQQALSPGNEPLRLVHHHAGYVRVRAGAFVQPGDSPVLIAARAAAEETPGFRAWSHNPKTGSVVVEYEPAAVECDDLLQHLAVSAGFRGVENDIVRDMQRKELVDTFMDAVEEVNRMTGRATGGKADLRELVPAALAATSVVSFIVTDQNRMPPWDSLLYHGYRIFMQWHRREVRLRVREVRKDESDASLDRRDAP